MNKRKFIVELEEELKHYQAADIDNTLDYYDEMIDDRLEAGESETDIILSLENPSQIAIRLTQNDRPKIQKQLSTPIIILIVILLILGAPVWGPLLLTAAVLIATVYFLIWVVPMIAGVIATSLIISGVISLGLSPFDMFNQGFNIGLMQFGVSFVIVGVGILFSAMTWYSTKYLIKYSISLTHWLIRLFRRQLKEVA
ncbi:DUF1700 domain-containing protein [Dellaglioa sp. P0083]|uniref:DUF1700 domain-containing protein n=1 Tax=Dellaglioa kimchii TaxID=3344667 RepID=UPI0038D361D5